MAGRIYRARECLKYGRSVLVSRPCIKLKVMNAKLEEYPEELSFYVDTGFEGAILVTEDVYRFLKWERCLGSTGEPIHPFLGPS
ncbi:hypothetical protein [Candidatus Methanodesulfokora washburnensis]|uniref:Uncharacterized protein n=1 Tax=Candidatus Methanodesulfokora washburnensis TaxID=2478471 RepID=A0A3R9QSE7_9CREN|nr:hypothetical protein [Candidatus Methanodesulfokores washburnensis]RSN71660.1 hypothetical protein D6D85_15570 [Candidatus Methanodesulfokores washburnensis]